MIEKLSWTACGVSCESRHSSDLFLAADVSKSLRCFTSVGHTHNWSAKGFVIWCARNTQQMCSVELYWGDWVGYRDPSTKLGFWLGGGVFWQMHYNAQCHLLSLASEPYRLPACYFLFFVYNTNCQIILLTNSAIHCLNSVNVKLTLHQNYLLFHVHF